MNCRTCECLAYDYEQIRKKYKMALDALESAPEKTPSSEHAGLNRIVNDSAMDLRITRTSLVEHRHSHLTSANS